MKARLLSTVAATLLFAAGAASAQTMNKDEAPGRAPAAQQNAPAEKIAPSLKQGEHKMPATAGQASPEHNGPRNDRDKRRRNPTWTSRRLGRWTRAPSRTLKASERRQGEARPGNHRSRRGGWFGEAVDRAAHQDHVHHQAAQSGAGTPQRFCERRNPRAGERACLPAASGSDRGLSRMARLRLHSGRRRDRRHRSAHARDRRDPRSVTHTTKLSGNWPAAGNFPGRRASVPACSKFFSHSSELPG